MESNRRKVKLAEMIAAMILDDIEVRGLKAGEPLMSESEIVAAYQCGRASVREALRILETNGLVTIKAGPKGGVVVGRVDPVQFGRMASRYFQLGGSTIRELVEARLVLEPVLTAMAARRRNGEDIRELQAFIDSIRSSPTVDENEYMRESFKLHSLMTGMSGNRVLDLYCKAMKDVFTSRVRGLVIPASREKHVRSVHVQIALAVSDGDAATAEHLMASHLQEYASYAARRLPGLMESRVSWQ